MKVRSESGPYRRCSGNREGIAYLIRTSRPVAADL